MPPPPAVGAREDLVSLRRDEGPQQTRATFVERYVCIMDGGARGDGDGREEKESIGSNVKVSCISTYLSGVKLIYRLTCRLSLSA